MENEKTRAEKQQDAIIYLIEETLLKYKLINEDQREAEAKKREVK